MKKFPFKKIDAFATQLSSGNPAGYITLANQTECTGSEMLGIARELKGYVNEVGFLTRLDETVFSLTFYSSEREVDFCGHATIAIMYDLITNDTILIDKPSLTIVTNRGTLTVENRIRSENAVFIMSPIPDKIPVMVSHAAIAEHLAITPESIDPHKPVSIINAGLATLLVPIKDLSTLLAISPNEMKLKQFCLNEEIDIVELFTSDVADTTNDYRVRVFAPTFGYLEDPATGSGNSALGYYLLKQNGFNKPTITIEQNASKEHCNIIKLQKTCDATGMERILFGGSAVTRIAGEYFVNA